MVLLRYFFSDYSRIVSDNAVSKGHVNSSSPSVESSLLVHKAASEASSVPSIESVPCRDESLQQMLRTKTEETWRLEKEGLSSSASGNALVPSSGTEAGPRADIGAEFPNPSADVPPLTCSQEQHEAAVGGNFL